ncbi:putative potassium transporter 12 [Bienertia sinuspersici]
MGIEVVEESSSLRWVGSGGSGTSRWVDGSEVSSDETPIWSKMEEDDFRNRYGSASGSVKRRLVKKPKRVDSLDVEAMQIAGAHSHHDKDLSTWRTLALAFQTLGVVYGDMGTSPLYVFTDVFSKVPITSEVDILGALYAKVSVLPNQQQADEQISSFRLKLPSPELARALSIKEVLEKNPFMKTLLLLLVLTGTSLIIGDGILTPAMSVMSAVSGLQGEINGFDTNAVVIVSMIILIGLFSIQSFGTSKVGFSFAPALSLWFFSLASIGSYNLFKYDITVLRAINPVYIYLFFSKNGTLAWSALGGCVLCITGAEAMFADLGHFSIAFTTVVFPCLLLAYVGQAAFLMRFPASTERVFYDSVPGIAEVGVMLVSTTLVTVVMLLIWQTNIFIALAFPIIFGAIELIYLSAVLSKILEGGWLPLAFASCFLLVMFTWNYGSVLKYRCEVRDKMSMDIMHELGSTLGTVRVPGVGLLYNELVHGVPSILGQFLLSLPAIHSTIIFVCIKYVPVPVVPQEERFLFRRICPKDYHMFRCVARYGYKDVRKEDHHSFEQLLVQSLKLFLKNEARDSALEASLNEELTDMDSVSVRSRDAGGVVDDDDLRTPLMQDQRLKSEADDQEELPSSAMSSSEDDPSLEYEFAALREAVDSGFTYLLGDGDVRAKKESFFLKKLVINYFYSFLRRNCRRGAAILKVPHMNIMEVGMTYMV